MKTTLGTDNSIKKTDNRYVIINKTWVQNTKVIKKTKKNAILIQNNIGK